MIPQIIAAAAPVVLDAVFGGGSSGGGGGSSSPQSNPLDFYARYGAEAAAANNPLTLATSEFANALSSSTYGQALLAQGLNQGSLTALQDAKTRGDAITGLQTSEVAKLLSAGIGLQEDLGKARTC